MNLSNWYSNYKNWLHYLIYATQLSNIEYTVVHNKLEHLFFNSDH